MSADEVKPHGDTKAEVNSLLAQFTHLRTPYKTVNDHAITVDILVPKDYQPSTTGVPVIARLHGGGLVTGSSMFLDWIAPWNLHWAIRHSAVVVLPNHRLLPEANGAEILEDLIDFWHWVASDLQDYISSHIASSSIRIDLSKTIALGESAGGYLAVQTGFLAPMLAPSVQIRAIVAPFPMLDMEDPWFTVAGHRNDEKFFHFPALPISLIDDHVAAMKKNDPIIPVSEDPQLSRLQLMVAALQHGTFGTWMKGDGELKDEYYPLRRVKTLSSSFPPLFIMHGIQDSAVPVEGSHRFVDALKQQLPNADVILETHDGDHGFDKELDLNKGWLAEGMKWLDEKAGLV